MARPAGASAAAATATTRHAETASKDYQDRDIEADNEQKSKQHVQLLPAMQLPPARTGNRFANMIILFIST
ncbi:MAG: hypothetical protein C0605_03135 [Hyphomicrobiales bacterium]|nr:MAG: hypothetical protein C0605_03135 [Hyphomicrobiales bacterium]